MCQGLYAGQIAECLGFYNEAEKAFRTPVKQRKLVAPFHLWLVLNGAVARDDGQHRWDARIDAVLLALADSSEEGTRPTKGALCSPHLIQIPPRPLSTWCQ